MTETTDTATPSTGAKGSDPSIGVAFAFDGADLAVTITAFFADPKVEHGQAYFAERGCWAARVSRAES